MLGAWGLAAWWGLGGGLGLGAWTGLGAWGLGLGLGLGAWGLGFGAWGLGLRMSKKEIAAAAVDATVQVLADVRASLPRDLARTFPNN